MPGTGQIRIRTYASRAVLPLTDTTIAIESERGGNTTLLALRQTDESGLTPYISVETPDLSNSLTPNQPRGWTNVTIIASHPGFDRVVIRDVQIFPGVVTQQAVEMFPTAMFNDGQETQQYDIPPQDL